MDDKNKSVKFIVFIDKPSGMDSRTIFVPEEQIEIYIDMLTVQDLERLYRLTMETHNLKQENLALLRENDRLKRIMGGLYSSMDKENA